MARLQNQLQNCIAIKAGLTQLLLLAILLCAATLAHAAGMAGTVVNLSGPLLAKKPDGSVKVLSLKSEVESGDTLITEKNTYARVRFIDNSEITLRPDSQVKIDSFSYDEAKPDADSATFSLVKGGLRAITGALGKRNRERVGLNTPTATIGIRGTTFIAQYVPPPPAASGPNDNAQSDLVRNLLSSTPPTPGGTALTGRVGSGGPPSPGQMPTEKVGGSPPSPGGLPPGPIGTPAPATPSTPPASGGPSAPAGPLTLPPIAPMPSSTPSTPSAPTGPSAPPPLAPGLHLNVTDGAILVTNNGGSLGFQAGQFGYVPSINQPPVIVPSNPNIQFVPPPSFNAGNAGGPGSSGQSEAVDCVVR